MLALNKPAESLRPSHVQTFLTSPLALIFAACVLWSTGGLFIKATTLSAFAVSFWRSLFATITVAYFTRREGFKFNWFVIASAALYAGLLLLFVVATKLTTAANAIFLQYTAPIYVLVLEPLFFKEKFRRKDLIVVGVCVVGMMLFFVGKLRADDVRGNIAALASGVCFALFALSLRHAQARKFNRAASVIYGNLLLVIALAPFGIAAAQTTMTARDVWIVLYLGIVQLGFGYLLFTRGMERGARSLDAGIVGYIEPVLNPLWVFIFLGERPTAWSLLGGTIIIAAVAGHTATKVRSRKAKP